MARKKIEDITDNNENIEQTNDNKFVTLISSQSGKTQKVEIDSEAYNIFISHNWQVQE